MIRRDPIFSHTWPQLWPPIFNLGETFISNTSGPRNTADSVRVESTGRSLRRIVAVEFAAWFGVTDGRYHDDSSMQRCFIRVATRQILTSGKPVK